MLPVGQDGRRQADASWSTTGDEAGRRRWRPRRARTARDAAGNAGRPGGDRNAGRPGRPGGAGKAGRPGDDRNAGRPGRPGGAGKAGRPGGDGTAVGRGRHGSWGGPLVLAAEVSATDIAAIVIAVLAGIGLVGLLLVLRAATRTLGALRIAVDDLRRETVPLLADVHAAVRRANTDLERVDGLLGTAESISTTVDSASRLAYLAFSNPVIKILALASGTSRAARRLRRDH
jgi:hypothetical protein